MDFNLVVIRPFGAYARGDAIVKPDDVARVLGSENAENVVRVIPPSVPASSGKKEG